MTKATVIQYDTLAAEAAAFAIRAHDGQTRTGTGWPYVVHPLNVGFILREHYPDNTDLEAAGYLHDVVEDTSYDIGAITERFGIRVAFLVQCVTNTGPEWRLEDYRLDRDVLRLKAADTLDNVRDTVRGLEKGHDVWSRFRAGKRKADTWRKHADLIWRELPGERIAIDLHDIVLRAEGMR